MSTEVIAALVGAIVGALLTFGLGVVARHLGERRRIQHEVFSTLVRYRGQILHADAVAAINMIDLVFMDAPEVRGARQQYMEVINKRATLELRRERFYKIVEAMARYLKVSHGLSAKDIENAWYPEFIGKSVDVMLDEIEQKWQAIRARSAPSGMGPTVPPTVGSGAEARSGTARPDSDELDDDLRTDE
jgi:hypothetical protein